MRKGEKAKGGSSVCVCVLIGLSHCHEILPGVGLLCQADLL